MSGQIVIYNKAGADFHCLLATYHQIKNLVDERSYKIEYLSQAPNAIDEKSSMRLFVVPGGSYLEMADEIKPIAERIHQLVHKEGMSYLGICAGAIAATSRPMLFPEQPILSNKNLELSVFDQLQGKMHLKLYSNHCIYWDVPGSGFYGAQKVCKVSSLDKSEQDYYPLFFCSGVCFSNVREEPDATPLLEYGTYRFSGFYAPQDGPTEVYDNIVPIAALTQKVGNGRIVLSGVHPEISSEVVERLWTSGPFQEKAKRQAIASLSSSVEAQNDTMLDYLKHLCIATKKA